MSGGHSANGRPAPSRVAADSFGVPAIKDRRTKAIVILKRQGYGRANPDLLRNPVNGTPISDQAHFP